MLKRMPIQEDTGKLQSVDGNLPIKLSDHSSLQKILKQRFSETHSKQIFTSLLFIEFDDLSRFNDAFGFNIDDKLMLKISDDISLLLNSKDIIGRVVLMNICFIFRRIYWYKSLSS